MPIIKNETDSVKDFLVLYGDLVVKTGQSGLRAALDSLPGDYSQMNDWCDHWLHEQGKEQILKTFNINSYTEAKRSH
ncbi:MAG: hypothetical protein PVG66_06055 [Chromatiales bacterium]